MKTDKFTVGEVVQSDGSKGSGISFVVLELLENQKLRVKLTEVSDFWKEQGVSVDQECILEHIKGGNEEWTFEDMRLPWFVLSIKNGEKRFLHYR